MQSDSGGSGRKGDPSSRWRKRGTRDDTGQALLASRKDALT